MGDNGASLKLGPEPAVPPSRNDEIGQDEDIPRKQHAENQLKEEHELLESLGVGGGHGRSDGLNNLGPLEDVPRGGAGGPES